MDDTNFNLDAPPDNISGGVGDHPPIIRAMTSTEMGDEIVYCTEPLEAAYSGQRIAALPPQGEAAPGNEDALDVVLANGAQGRSPPSPITTRPALRVFDTYNISVPKYAIAPIVDYFNTPQDASLWLVNEAPTHFMTFDLSPVSGGLSVALTADARQKIGTLLPGGTSWVELKSVQFPTANVDVLERDALVAGPQAEALGYCHNFLTFLHDFFDRPDAEVSYELATGNGLMTVPLRTHTFWVSFLKHIFEDTRRQYEALIEAEDGII